MDTKNIGARCAFVYRVFEPHLILDMRYPPWLGIGFGGPTGSTCNAAGTGATPVGGGPGL